MAILRAVNNDPRDESGCPIRHTDADPVPMTATSPFNRRDVILLCLLAVIAILVFGKDISVGGLRDGDSSAHAMDGVLILDWVRAGPAVWLHPMDFAVEQYSHYPTLAIGRHYPPGFAIVEALFFAIFGVSAMTARMCVVFFGILTVIGAYVFVWRFSSRAIAFMCGVVLVTMPMTTWWGRQEMLELPTLAMMIWSAVAIHWYLSKPGARRLVLVLFTLVVCLLFRQTALCLVAAVALLFLIMTVRHAVPRTHAVVTLLFAIAAAPITVLSLDAHGRKLVSGDETIAWLDGLARITFYARQIPEQVGYFVLPFMLIGAWSAIRRFPRESLLLGAWLLVGYAMLTIPDYKNPRFFFVLLFPLAVWAAIGFERAVARVGVARIQPIAAVVAVLLIAKAIAQPIEHRPDYGPVVLAHRDRIENHVVMFSGLREGDFVFAVRQHIPWRRAAVMRTSKLLYTCSGRPDLDFQSNVASVDDVAGVMQRFAFQTVFVERKNKVGVIEEDMLREYLAEGKYDRISSHDLEADDLASFRDVIIDVYDAHDDLTRTADFYDVPLPRANRSVRVSLNQEAS